MLGVVAKLSRLLHSSLSPSAIASVLRYFIVDREIMSQANGEAWSLYEFFYGPRDDLRAARWHEPYASDYRYDGTGSTGNRRSKSVTVELKCLMCCEACENRVRDALSQDSDVSSFTVDRELRKVTVSGEDLRAAEVLKIVRNASERTTDLWPVSRRGDHNSRNECRY